MIVSTPQILTNLLKTGKNNIFKYFVQQCNNLIVDEAHHIAAKTWKEIKLSFESIGKPVLLFTATPFRNDGGRIEGETIYNYPLSLAQRDKYYEKSYLLLLWILIQQQLIKKLQKKLLKL